jgi:hypothetical protein
MLIGEPVQEMQFPGRVLPIAQSTLPVRPGHESVGSVCARARLLASMKRKAECITWAKKVTQVAKEVNAAALNGSTDEDN